MSEDARRTFEIDNRRLSVLVDSLFSSWILFLLFEGQIFYSLADAYTIGSAVVVFCGVAALFVGLLLCGLLIQTVKGGKSPCDILRPCPT